MNLSELLIPEIEHETKLNEAFLQRVPDDKLDWSPHEKSMRLGVLCSHLVELYDWISATMDSEGMDLAEYKAFRADSSEAILARLGPASEQAKTSLNQSNDAYWLNWTMRHGDQVVMEMPRYTVLRSMVLNQFPHHRAQLGVYLRILDIKVPASYGPSADEN